MARPPGLVRRGNRWQMRVRVPKCIQSAIGKREVVRSLGDLSNKDAYRAALIERANIEREFEAAEVQLGLSQPSIPRRLVAPPALSQAALSKIARRYLQELEAERADIPLSEAQQQEMRESLIEEARCVGRPNAADDAELQGWADSYAQRNHIELPPKGERYPYYLAIREAELEHLERQLLRLGGATVARANPAFVDVDGTNSGEEERTTIAEAVELYIEAPERSANSASTKKMDRSRLGVLRDILGSARPVASINKADMRAYVEQLLRLPQHYAQRYPGKSPAEAIAAAREEGAKTLSATSVKRNIQAVRSLFAWLERQDIIEKSPATHLEGPRAPKKSNRRPFTTEEIQTLLRLTAQDKDWQYWLVRIALLHGFRLTEPLGLKVDDIVEQDGVMCFRIRPNEYRSLKTEDTSRDVPIHPRLIELGILDLAANREPNELLIPGVPVGEGKAFNSVQKKIGRIIRKEVSSDPNLTFHSLRHNFRDAMRDGNFPRGVEERLGGWKATTNDAMEGYGRGYRLEVLRDWIAKVVFKDIEVT